MNLVEAAFRGDAALAEALANLGRVEAPARGPETSTGSGVEPPGAYLERIEVSGFRGVGGAVEIELPPGPGLTVITGRNGSGKSSFAEGLETLLTGTSGRWSDRRSKLWREGWRNLHAKATALEARVSVEGAGTLQLRRAWQPDDALEASTFRVHDDRGRDTSLDALGWTEALASFRPFLSYQELGVMVDEPSKAFDRLWGLLGLEEIQSARDRLATPRKSMEKRAREEKARRKELESALQGLDDPRAPACLASLAARPPAVGAIADLLAGRGEEQDADVPVLRELTRLRVPPPDLVAEVVDGLVEARRARDGLTGELAEAHASLAGVLERALRHQEAYGQDSCPVCAAPLTPEFVDSARSRLEASRRLASEVRQADERLEASGRRARELFAGVTAERLAVAERLGLGDGASRAHAALQDGDVTDPAHLRAHAPRVSEALQTLAEGAAAAVAAKEERFLPVAERLVAWVPEARSVQADAESLRALKAAEKWLKDAEIELRDARFAPIADEVRKIWDELGAGSSVDLRRIALAGAANRRRLDLEVSVDGQEGTAVAVMSQGELNALALSLFLPRMMLSESPFRFLVIDDPVQAMDPFKVDGLARVLGRVAKRRQVLVLTHDPRLLEALRRQRLEAAVLEVSRRAESVVEVRRSGGPVKDHLEDARSLAHDAGVGQEVAQRLVPGFCRAALEAACVSVVRRRRLLAGEPHADVEATLGRADTLMKVTALALFDDPGRTGDVYASLENRLRGGCDTFKACKEGAHGPVTTDLRGLVRSAERLATVLENVR